jgi:indolepyruvate ferredoxin oxidoreductase alpha subunit
VGCAYRGLLYNVKRLSRKEKGVVFGDIGCHDAGSFKPLELQSTIYCMGSSVPMATGAYFADLKRPIFSIMGDSTFFHLGLNGLINASYQNANQVVILCDNSTTAMTGFQPHAGSGINLHGNDAKKIDIDKIGEAINVSVHHIDAYDIEATYATLKDAVEEEGVSLVVSSSPCYLKGSKEEIKFFDPKEVHVDPEKCNGCMICINDFGCPALIYDPDENKVHADTLTCVQCGLCIEVCKQGAIL